MTYSTFPTVIDTFSTNAIDTVDILANGLHKVQASHINKLREIVLKLEQSVGTKAPSIGTSLEERVAAIVIPSGGLKYDDTPYLNTQEVSRVPTYSLLTVDSSVASTVKRSTNTRDTKIAGIAIADTETLAPGRLIQLSRKPLNIVLVTTATEAINVGDFLVPSNVVGHAKRGTSTSNGVFAVALQSLPQGTTGAIQILLSIGGGSGGGGGEWVPEPEVSSTFTTSTAFTITDTDNVKLNTYNAGRYLRFNASTVTEFFAQVFAASYSTGVLDVTVTNPQTKLGVPYVITPGDTIITLECSAMQMKYMGTSGDVNPLNKTLLDHVKDGSIHTTFDQIYKVDDLSSQVAAVAGNVAGRTLTHQPLADGTLLVYRNGLLMPPSEYSDSTSTGIVTIVPSVWDYENITITYIAFGKFHTVKFNDFLTVSLAQQVFYTTLPFNQESLQVFRNGQMLKEGAGLNDFTIMDANKFSLNTGISDLDEYIICNYDKVTNQFPRNYSVYIPGIAEVGINKGIKAICNRTGKILKVYAASDTAPDADLRIDIKKCGPADNGVYSSIFLSNAEKPTILSGTYVSQVSDILNLNVVEGTRLRADIETCGTSSPGGNDLLINIYVEE